MARIVTYVWRLIWVISAVVVAVLAGLVLFYTTTRLAMGHVPDPAIFVTQLGSYLMTQLGSYPVYVPLALGLAAVTVTVLEYAGMRSGITYGMAAAVCTALTIFIIAEVPILMMGANIAMAVQAVLASFIAGLIYWILAGRTAGRWRI